MTDVRPEDQTGNEMREAAENWKQFAEKTPDAATKLVDGHHPRPLPLTDSDGNSILVRADGSKFKLDRWTGKWIPLGDPAATPASDGE